MTSVDLHHHRQRLCSTDLLGEGSVFETRLGSGGGLTPSAKRRRLIAGLASKRLPNDLYNSASLQRSSVVSDPGRLREAIPAVDQFPKPDLGFRQHYQGIRRGHDSAGITYRREALRKQCEALFPPARSVTIRGEAFPSRTNAENRARSSEPATPQFDLVVPNQLS